MFTEGVSWHYYRYKSASPLRSQFDTLEKRTDDENMRSSICWLESSRRQRLLKNAVGAQVR
jgi:hypothetical protein